ncbi:protein PERCC1 [Kryptolebias marmoratus]|uniref:protein PERCC1 n=1 Tax=Kryptolebias marmoratus TaxID=37003 RepID=UPI000D52F1DF|nr:protein PERCC1 [Kryptolebias marmoratus]
MATGVLRNFLLQGPNPAYVPMLFQHSSSGEDEEGKLEGREDEGEREEEDEEEDEECEVQEDEADGFSEFLSTHSALDVTSQLLRFADLISRDIQRYFGRCSDDRESCDIYSNSVSTTTSGRRRYYDDLLRLARADSPEERGNGAVSHADEPGVTVAKGNSGLGPLAELFNHRGPSQGQGQPMVKRHLPLSFWTEPVPHCYTPDLAHSNTLAQEHRHTHHNPLDCMEPDFSDLLAYWDPHLEFTHTLTEDTHAVLNTN